MRAAPAALDTVIRPPPPPAGCVAITLDLHYANTSHVAESQVSGRSLVRDAGSETGLSCIIRKSCIAAGFTMHKNNFALFFSIYLLYFYLIKYGSSLRKCVVLCLSGSCSGIVISKDY